MTENKNEQSVKQQKISARGFGAAIDLENISLNTFFTLIGFMLIVLISWGYWRHEEDSKYHQREMVGLIKEVVHEQRVMIQAMREANCLSTLSQEEKKRDSEICKRGTR